MIFRIPFETWPTWPFFFDALLHKRFKMYILYKCVTKRSKEIYYLILSKKSKKEKKKK